jgi:hypothetical protein
MLHRRHRAGGRLAVALSVFGLIVVALFAVLILRIAGLF